MDFVFQSLEDWIKGFAVESIRGNLTSIFADVNSQAVAMGAEVIVTPSSYSPEIWQLVMSVSQTVIMPVAVLLLTAVLCVEVAGLANDFNNMHSSQAILHKLFWLILGKFGIGVLLVSKAHEFTIGIFDVGAYLIGQSMGLVSSDYTINVGLSVETVCNELMTRDLPYVVGTLAFTSIGGFILKAMFIAMKIILWGRIIEIYLYASVGAVPYVTFLNRDMSSIGQNYVKNLCALAFQGFFIFMLMGMYAALAQGIQHTNDPQEAIVQLFVLSGVMVLALVRSKGIAKSIFAAS